MGLSDAIEADVISVVLIARDFQVKKYGCKDIADFSEQFQRTC